MKYNGQIPQAVAGEIAHVVNNRLGAAMLKASQVPGPVGAELEDILSGIAKYIYSLGHKTEWDSSRFDNPAGASHLMNRAG